MKREREQPVHAVSTQGTCRLQLLLGPSLGSLSGCAECAGQEWRGEGSSGGGGPGPEALCAQDGVWTSGSPRGWGDAVHGRCGTGSGGARGVCPWRGRGAAARRAAESGVRPGLPQVLAAAARQAAPPTREAPAGGVAWAWRVGVAGRPGGAGGLGAGEIRRGGGGPARRMRAALF